MKLDIYNLAGNKTKKSVEISEAVFGIQPNEHCVYLAVKSEMASLHQGTHQSKNRSAVSGSGKKPYKQKGTGRARVGSSRNPSRVHGGTAFGPKSHSYNIRVNKKVRRLARKSVLSDKMSQGQLMVIDEFKLDLPKTKDIMNILSSLDLSSKKVTILAGDLDENVWLSARNLKNVSILQAADASAYDLLDCEIVLFDKAGIELLNNQLS
ncbi:MAG: 50S ribosomal protein L4 [Candidatus Marinimicrobia bacterium]|nr:50S ribosomal protein L4 [Candidatus Neomarinimicrobiota bacterium]|tara:strand:+ start:633 stop:1259 length:627 start_codon:yes stop_codon:yes gene_type:complete